ncbi:soluble lytic murein transglycosylase and related regulatory protein [Serpentinimonas raichei]|uniref:Soluble lytic murein transglycosylase and related regulatory protein n=1 Tax=Serpentinimonas raichei TaxID=1458425 RepID=A0A060NLR2_9BURK|nr:transglycosylase SLT domain-containing protein [Serpentinimonas raichei]BAO80458.1 soluble lytic murein transglycosylase and related regulatory protein [Serpentinimonas raichei]
MTSIAHNLVHSTLRLVLPLAAALWLSACAAPGGLGTTSQSDAIAHRSAADPAAQTSRPASLPRAVQPNHSSAADLLQGASDHPTQPGLAQSGGSLGLRPLIPSGPLLALGRSSATSHPVSVAPLEAPRDLWERMRRSFAMPDLDTDLVRLHEQWHASRPQNLERMVQRSSKYLFHIVEEAERRGLPMEVALVPFIESAFNPQAVSPVKAAGLWQFMPATGRSFDLMQNAFRDDRRDVLASTNAALDYLQRLHRMFGDWQLALAAYNWGNGNVQRAIRANRAAGLGTSYLDLRMPNETRNYVPKLQAIENLIRDPQRLGINLPVIGNHPFFDSVTLTRDIDVALVAELADVSIENFRQLNPSHDKPVIMAAGTPNILLPWDNALTFQQRLREHQGAWATWTAWRVPQNMSVAQAAQQHDLSEARLREVNDIPRRSSQLRAGSTLLVPRLGNHEADVPEHLADGGQILLGRDQSGSASTSPTQGQRSIRVTVRSGDTLSSLARRHSVSVANLRSWNQLRPNASLRVGQVLLVQRSAAPASRNASRTASAAPAPRSSTPAKRTGTASTAASNRPAAQTPVRSAQANASQSKVAVR